MSSPVAFGGYTESLERSHDSDLNRTTCRRWVVVLLCLGIGFCGTVFGGEGIKELQEPRGVAGFELPGIDGKLYRLSDYEGGFLLVNFWAVWCTPCRREIPSLKRLHKQLGGKGFRLISVHMGPSLENAAQVAVELEMSFPVVVDDDMTLTSWGVRGLPTSYLLDPTGRIMAEAVGDREWDIPSMIEAISQMQKDWRQAGGVVVPHPADLDALHGQTGGSGGYRQ